MLFELKKIYKKGHIFYIVILVLALLAFDCVMELLTGELGKDNDLKVSNLSQAICQFSVLLMIPVFSNVFSSEYKNKSISFYENNRVDLRNLYIVRSIVYNLSVVLVYSIAQCIFLIGFHIEFNRSVLEVLLLNLLVVLVSVNAILFFSMLCKRKWVVISYILGFWIGAQIINSLEIPYLSGYFFPVDSESVVACYINESMGLEVSHLSGSTFQMAAFTCFIWILVFAVAGIITSKKAIRKNSI